mmetsp:Transcript_10032/g.24715  ORF Transcript_10032/g.24715 Transcript_10032/m.24715 type:complete len:287 (+) Transcript_10032:70-930(+)|eukprot:CAMPEP_0197575478 /NCGR_PEP_ID=MMETSP1326-20131121/864_1 /TAXON_ID=1155430 /ORGANISM="Genus nov. species nov., Strain RCC2288" /LENGTH=286 /DNA_ID=CAMNT_0043138253 /DNA_START=75 /DNA_END=935 /DNA_ORIENTATION=-
MASMTAAVPFRAALAAPRAAAGAKSSSRAVAVASSSSAPTVARKSLQQRGSATLAGEAGRVGFAIAARAPTASSSSSSSVRRHSSVVTRATSENASENEAAVSRKVARTAGACKTLGRWGFWGQLVLTVVSAVILIFSFIFKGITKATDAGLYFILFGICAAFFTTFWSLGIVRLGEKLRQSATQLSLVPPRTEVVRMLSTGLAVNFVGLGATIIGLQATTGLLFAKALTAAAATPFMPGAGSSLIALDIFMVQAASNVMLAHWIGAAISLWLLRTVNLPTPNAAN